ncbi:MAG: hypothetical protein HYV32_03895 [Candidatus Kerfeldbacteria bacterium]|nr:hypothetical protein [Candidatus Kerfeldbacteria bacterium]
MRFKGGLFLLTATLFFSAAFVHVAQAASDVFNNEQNGSLRQSLQLDGGYVESLAQGSDGMLYTAINAPNGLYASQDEGETWLPVQEGGDIGAGHNVVAADDAIATAFAVAGISLYKTTDGGETWEEVYNGDYDQSTLLYTNGLLLVPVRDGSITVSDDMGVTLTNYTLSGISNDRIAALAVSESTGALYAISGQNNLNRVYTSIDNGQTWMNTGISGDWDEIAVDPTDDQFIVLAGDDGAQYTTTGLVGPWTDMNDLDQMPTPAARGYATILSSGRIYVGPQYTDDNGTTWRTMGSDITSLDSFLRGNMVLFDKDYATNDRIWAQCGRGPCVSNDNGVTWEDKVMNMTGVTIYDMSIDETKEVVWLAAQGGVAKSENFSSSIAAGGSPTWTFPIYPDAGPGEVSNISSTSAIWMDPTNADVVIAAVGTAVYRTDDGGTTWTAVDVDIKDEYRGIVTEIIQDAPNNILYLSYRYQEGTDGQTVGGGVYMSEDNGETWTDLGAPDVPVISLGVDADGKLLAGLGSELESDAAMRGLYLYDGSTWTFLSSDSSHLTYGQMVNDIVYIPAADRFVIVAGETNSGGVFTSNDSNDWADWEEIGNGLPTDFWGQAVTQDPTGAQAVYVSTARPAGTGYIYKCSAASSSEDAGCDLYYTGLIDEQFETLLFDGLLSGSTLGIFAYQSKANVTLAKKKLRKHQFRLTARVKDSVTEKSLNGRSVQFFAKAKNGQYKIFAKKKIKKGKAILTVTQNSKQQQFQLRFRPKTDADQETYGTTSLNSDAVTIPKL